MKSIHVGPSLKRLCYRVMYINCYFSAGGHYFLLFFFPKFWEPEVTKYYAPPYNFLFRPWILAIADL